MSDAKHTRGPWHVLPLQTHIAADAQQAGSFSIGNSADVNQAVILCSRWPWPERADEMRANANLIAAAPELLSALIQAEAKLVELEHAVGGGDDEIYVEGTILTCRAVIAKATEA